MRSNILGYGMYVPKFRLKCEEVSAVWGGGKGTEKAVANGDEDVITMAVEAAQSALAHSGIAAEEIGAVYFATNSSPYLEQEATGLIAEILAVPSNASLADFTGSPRAAIGALQACVDGVESSRLHSGLVIAADNRPASPGSTMEATFGAGAVAFVVGVGEGVANIARINSYADFYIDRWRAFDDAYVRDFDQRFTRQYGYLKHSQKAIEAFFRDEKKKPSDYDHLVLQESDARAWKELGSWLGVPKDRWMTSAIFPLFGDLGAASLFMGLASVFSNARAEEEILALSYGAGTSDVVAFKMLRSEGRDPSPTLKNFETEKIYIDYIKYLKMQQILSTGDPPYPLSVPPLSPAFMRGKEEILRLRANRCKTCSYINYPPSIRTICIRCGKTDFEPFYLSKRGIVHTFCINYYMPPGFEVPLANILVDLDSGGRYVGMGTEIEPEELKVGMPVELALRRITKERGVSVYGFKIKPLRDHG